MARRIIPSTIFKENANDPSNVGPLSSMELNGTSSPVDTNSRTSHPQFTLVSRHLYR